MKEIPGFFDYCMKHNINAVIDFVLKINDKEAINEFARHQQFYVREKVASSPHLTKESLHRLVHDEMLHVREEAAENPNLTQEMKKSLLKDTPCAHLFFSKNPNVLPEDVIHHPAIFQNKNLSQETLLQAIKIVKPRWSAIADKKLTKEMIEFFLDECDIESIEFDQFLTKISYCFDTTHQFRQEAKPLYLKLLSKYSNKFRVLKEARNKDLISREEFETLKKNFLASSQF